MAGQHDTLVTEILGIVDALREAGAAVDDEYSGQPVEFWRFPAIEAQIRAVGRQIVALNPEMLSGGDVARGLHFPLLTDLLAGRLWERYDQEYEPLTPRTLVERHIERQVQYRAWANIEVPVLHLPVARGDEVLWGSVTFKGVNPWGDLGDREGLEVLIQQFNGRLNGLASVRCPGDPGHMWAHLNSTIATALRQIVGAAWPRHRGSGFTPPSIVGRGWDPSFTPLFTDGNLRANSYRLAKGHPRFNYPGDVLAEWGARDFEGLRSLSVSDPSDRTDMEDSVMSALAWLGAASEPDVIAMRVVKLATALESLIGDQSPDPRLTSGGITATLAERCAFLVGDDSARRRDVHRQVVGLYGKRSGVLHRDAVVTEDEIGDDGFLVWEAVRAVIRLLPELSSRDDLRDWTLRQRYG